MEIPPLPKNFDLQPFLGRWLDWARVERCFWPGAGQRAAKIDRDLAPVRYLGGVYLLAWQVQSPESVSHLDPAVVYVGETSEFRSRMAGWGRSAGFWGEREDGHSAAWRWDQGSKDLWVAFFPLTPPESRRLAKHVRLYYEIMATEEFRSVHGKLPRANEWEAVKDA